VIVGVERGAGCNQSHGDDCDEEFQSFHSDENIVSAFHWNCKKLTYCAAASSALGQRRVHSTVK
jgi:hypothetical protein